MDEDDAEVADLMANEDRGGNGGTSTTEYVLECSSGVSVDFEDGAVSGEKDTEIATLYAKGVAFERNGKPAYALKCYMDCLKSLADGTTFSKLPQCLHRIADIYYEDKQCMSVNSLIHNNLTKIMVYYIPLLQMRKHYSLSRLRSFIMKKPLLISVNFWESLMETQLHLMSTLNLL
jgi:hypothetical protein